MKTWDRGTRDKRFFKKSLESKKYTAIYLNRDVMSRGDAEIRSLKTN